MSRSKQAAQIRDYVQAMEAAVEEADDEVKAAAFEWIEWATRYADAVDH